MNNIQEVNTWEKTKVFTPMDHFDWINSENGHEMNLASAPATMPIFMALMQDYSWKIQEIFWETEQVAKIIDFPSSDVADEMKIVESLIWTIIPAKEIDEENRTITVSSKAATISLWMEILRMINKWDNKDMIEKAHKSYELFKELGSKDIQLKFWENKSAFPKVMEVRV